MQCMPEAWPVVAPSLCSVGTSWYHTSLQYNGIPECRISDCYAYRTGSVVILDQCSHRSNRWQCDKWPDCPQKYKLCHFWARSSCSSYLSCSSFICSTACGVMGACPCAAISHASPVVYNWIGSAGGLLVHHYRWSGCRTVYQCYHGSIRCQGKLGDFHACVNSLASSFLHWQYTILLFVRSVCALSVRFVPSDTRPSSITICTIYSECMQAATKGAERRVVTWQVSAVLILVTAAAVIAATLLVMPRTGYTCKLCSSISCQDFLGWQCRCVSNLTSEGS